MLQSRRIMLLFVVLLVTIPFVGCAKTRHSRSVQKSGFLGDYSDLKPGKSGQALLVFIDHDTDFTKYDKIQIESVEMVMNTVGDAVSPEENKALCAYLYNAFVRELGKDLEVVTKPGPGVLQLRAGITESDSANVVANSVTTIVPQTRLLSTLMGITADVAVVVGQASLEVEVKDAVSQKRLGAAVDRRVGSKTIRDAFSSWGDVEAAFDKWAEQTAARIRELRRVEES